LNFISLTLAKSSLETATGSLQEAKENLNKVTDKADAVTKAIDSFIAKVRDIKFKAKVDDADMEQAINNRKKLIENESKLLEDHRKENKEILTRHFYEMSNMMSRNEGVWLSNGWVKALLWIFLPCFLYTSISIVYLVASYIDK
jgi:virulence-associated protein VapD